MPTARLDQDVFAAGGTAATDWAQAGGNAQVTIAAGAQVARGLNFDLGISALANVDAGVGKFLSAELSGQASAAASVTAQIQVPMNLFGEIGFAVRLQAIAELAAAVQVSLGLKVGDFLELAGNDPNMRGLPVDLLRVFLSEIDIKAGLYAKAALTAQAYAQLVVTGTAIAQPSRNIRPGFNIVGGMGVGLKAGAGFRVFAAMEFADFSRFVARSVDVLVDGACREAAAGLPAGDATSRALLQAARPAFKMALRTAYELGEFIAVNAPTATAAGAEQVSLRCAQVALEEGQRFLLEGLADAALQALRTAMLGWMAPPLNTRWRASRAARRALSDHLDGFPAEPFDGTPATEAYWTVLVARIVDLAAAMAAGPLDQPTQRFISVLWSAAQLALIAARRVARADASLTVIGLPPRQVQAPFQGALTAQPPQVVRDHIRASLAAAPPGALQLGHLVEFLTADAVLDFLRQQNPGIDRFLDAMTGPLGTLANDVARTLLRNIGSTVVAGGRPDAQATLEAIAVSLRTFMATQIHEELAPVLRERLLSRPDVKTYFDEVFLPTTDFTLDTVFNAALDWSRRGADRERLKEALSGILMKLVGRSLVTSADIMIAEAQRQMHGILTDLADNVGAPNGIVRQLSRAANLPVPVSEIAEITADALRIGAEVLGPLTDTQRAKIRALMYRVIDPVPVDAGATFMRQLADSAFMPNGEAMMELAQELGSIGGERFLQFVIRLVELIGTKMLEELAAVIDAARAQIQQWYDDTRQAMEELQQQIGRLAAEIERLAAQVARDFDRAVDDLLGALAPLATRTGRRTFKARLADQVIGDAFAILDGNYVYRTLAPAAVRGAIRAAARTAVETALDNDVLDGVLDIVGEVAEEVDSLVDDIRDLDPNRDLAEQVGNLLLNRLTDAIHENLGRSSHINVGFDVTVLGTRHRISLGRIDVPVDAVVDGLRATIRQIDAFEDAVRDAAAALATAFAHEVRLQAAETERATRATAHARLGAQRAALEAAPRAVRILSPASGSAVTGQTRIRIEVEGLSREAIEDQDDRPSIVCMLLNGRALPLSTFTVTEVGTVAPPTLKPVPGFYDARLELDLKPHWAAIRAPTRPAKDTPGKAAAKLAAIASQRAPSRLAAPVPGSTPLAPLEGNSASVERTPIGRAERRFGRPLTVTQIGRLVGGTNGGVVLSCLLNGRNLQEGLNTLVVAVVLPGGTRLEASCTFFGETTTAPKPRPTPPKPGAIRLPGLRPVKPADLVPEKVAGKFVLPPKKDRLKSITALKEDLAQRGVTKRKTLRDALGVALAPQLKPGKR
jgi:hypothetical protein